MRGHVSLTEGEQNSVFVSLLAGLLLPCLVTYSPLGRQSLPTQGSCGPHWAQGLLLPNAALCPST